MELQHLNLKLFVEPPAPAVLAGIVPVFHSWIEHRAGDELLLDIADYRHVPEGPGIVLVGLEADYSLDHADGRWGVGYYRKAPLAGSNLDRLAQSARAALNACRRLEEDPRLQGGVRFAGRELEIGVRDRMLAANDAAGRAAMAAELSPFLNALLGGAGYELRFHDDSRRLLSAVVASARAFTASELLAALARPAAG